MLILQMVIPVILTLMSIIIIIIIMNNNNNNNKINICVHEGVDRSACSGDARAGARRRAQALSAPGTANLPTKNLDFRGF